MGYLIIIIVAIVVGAYLAWYDDLTALGCVSGFMIGAIVCVFVGVVVSGSAKTVETKTASQPIYALANGSGTGGAFFLGSGVIDKTEKYTYLVQTERGMQIQTTDVSDAYVKEDSKAKPEMITYTEDFASPALRFWFPDMTSSDTYTFVIPKGSVKYEYNVDVSK